MINLNKKHKAEIKEVGVLTQPTQPTPAPSTNNVVLTEEMCINFLKATGKYKISKSEVTTNWIEL